MCWWIGSLATKGMEGEFQGLDTSLFFVVALESPEQGILD